MAKYITDIAFSAALLLGAIYLWFVADAFPTFARFRNVDSDFWPKILLVIIGLVAAGILYQNVAALRLYRKHHRLPTGPAKSAGAGFDWITFLIAAGLVVAYYWGLQFLGFLISTVLFLAVAVNLVSYANRWLKAVFPFAFTALVGLIFVKVLSLPLPRGRGVFYEISLFFY